MQKIKETYKSDKECAIYKITCDMDRSPIDIEVSLQTLRKKDRVKIRAELNEIVEKITSLPQYRLLHMTGKVNIHYSLQLFGLKHDIEELKNMDFNIIDIGAQAKKILTQMGVKTLGEVADIIKKKNAVQYFSSISIEHIKIMLKGIEII